jgi:hypothetical protein
MRKNFQLLTCSFLLKRYYKGHFLIYYTIAGLIGALYQLLLYIENSNQYVKQLADTQTAY